MKTDPRKADQPIAAVPTLNAMPYELTSLNVETVVPNPHNRRIDENEEAFKDLVDSVRVQGVLDPITVRRTPRGFELHDGERRWRAARKIGLAQLPAVVWPESATSRQMLEMAFTLNHQRQEHSCLSTARQLRALKNQHACTHEDLAERLGVKLSRVKLYLALFGASDHLLEFLDSHDIPLSIAAEMFRYEKALGEVAARNLVADYRDRPLTTREIEDLRKRREESRSDRGGVAGAGARGRSARADLGTRFEQAFQRDPEATLRSLEEALARLGYQIRRVAPVPPTNSSGAEGAA